jgi:predicted  nucleic acid-binding Zn-ribbon protein
MTWATIIPILLGSSVIAGLVKVIEAAVGKWRPRTAVEDERSERAFREMERVAEAYKTVVDVHKRAAQDATDTLRKVNTELEEARKEIGRLSLEVHALETSLADASSTISQLMMMVSTTG